MMAGQTEEDRKGRVTKGDTQLEISGTASSAGAGDVGQVEGVCVCGGGRACTVRSKQEKPQRGNLSEV